METLSLEFGHVSLLLGLGHWCGMRPLINVEEASNPGFTHVNLQPVWRFIVMGHWHLSPGLGFRGLSRVYLLQARNISYYVLLPYWPFLVTGFLGRMSSVTKIGPLGNITKEIKKLMSLFPSYKIQYGSRMENNPTKLLAINAWNVGQVSIRYGEVPLFLKQTI